MESIFKSIAIGALVLASASAATAQEGKSTQADALALMKKAQEFVKVNGMEKATNEFNNLESPFNTKGNINRHADLYLFNIDFNGLQTIHGKNPKMHGKVLLEMRDAEGLYLVKALLEACKGSTGKGWVDTKWPNPVTKNLESKSAYVERVPGTEVCLGTGIYK
jgi:cytochrome c